MARMQYFMMIFWFWMHVGLARGILSWVPWRPWRPWRPGRPMAIHMSQMAQAQKIKMESKNGAIHLWNKKWNSYH